MLPYVLHQYLLEMWTLSLVTVLAVGIAAVTGQKDFNVIVGGVETSIENHPYTAALLYTADLAFYTQTCVGAVLNSRAVLSTAHCFYGDETYLWRIRVGSNYANSGGIVHIISRIINHPDFHTFYYENDIAVLHSVSVLTSNNVRPASIAGPNYIVPDTQPLLAVGWGKSSANATASERMRQIQVNYINMNTCRSIYVILAMYPTTDMMCSGWLDTYRGKECQGEAGGPVLHNNVIVGVTSWGRQCVLNHYPGISTRISNYTSWIQANA
ncbi:trypsin CFT-1 [Papilio machaon]|uniref:trypsin CFT-1 n=1 Tax=Papilio machaon TaxID=76193 RepID=UPI001E663689|nr:trypsin CFT-1 [Papilio machaon]